MKKIQKSGITIVTLVITVIILVILTGAVMLTMVGDNGIFGETQTTIDKYNKQATLEQIQLKIQKKRLAKVNEGQYSLNLSEDILPILETFGTYNENEMKLITTEKNIDIYLYEIINIPINEIANVTYTNQELTISEKVQLPNGYTFEYTKDNGITWSEYTSTTTIAEENGILIRLKNEEGKVVSSEYKVTSGVIEEIDSTKPIISIDTNGVTTEKTIKVTIIVTDEKGLDRNNTYEYCISTTNNDTTGATWIPYTNGISFTVGEGLTGGYYIHVKGVTDTSGNESGNKVSEMLTFDNTVPAVTIDIGRITDKSIEVLAQSTDNSGQVKSTEYSIDNGAHWYTANTFTNLTANTSYTVKVKSVDIFNNENTVEKEVTTNPRTWNGKIDISWYTKDPNKTTFDISTPNELAGLALLVDNETVYYDDTHDANNISGTHSIAGSEFEGKTIILNNNILMNENVLNEDGTLNEANASTFVQWEPIGEPSKIVDPNDNTQIIEIENEKVFKGTLDGQNNNILGLYIDEVIIWDQALVSQNYGIVENINVKNSYVHAEGGCIGVVVGSNYGIIENCTNYSTIVHGDYWAFAGGIAGWSSGEISSCNNYGIIEGACGIGGIVGQAVGRIINCANLGEMIFSGDVDIGSVCGGGIAYQTFGNDSELIIINCYNSSKVSGRNGGKFGAIFGMGTQLKVINCYNDGCIDNQFSYLGGICSRNAAYKAVGETEYIQNCYNLSSLNSSSLAGGITSDLENYSGRKVNIDNCFNLGEINGSTSGGVVGKLEGDHSISNCYNINISFFGQEIPSSVTVFNTGLIDEIQTLSPGITINGSIYTTLLDALNAWVDANKSTYPELKNWVRGDNGYPTFAN